MSIGEPTGTGDTNDQNEDLEPSVMDIFGGTEEERINWMGYFYEQINTHDGKDFQYDGKLYKVEDFEREKTEEETAMTQAVLDKLAEFIKNMGGEPVKLKPENVHFLDAEKAKTANLPHINFFDDDGQFIGIYDQGNNLANAQGIVHEGVHFNSFQTSEIEKNKRLSQRRVGISARIKGEQTFYFDDINEAITTELAKRFDKIYFGAIPELQDDLAERERLREMFLIQNPGKDWVAGEIAYVTPDSVTHGGTATRYTYSKERADVGGLIMDIFRKNSVENGGQFKDIEEVFKLFVDAAMQGNLLALARVVEKTYGEKSFSETKRKHGKGLFRKLGEGTKRPKG